jgi:hypothetical protein
MRILLFLFACTFLLAGCDESTRADQAPKQLRGCGELDGTAPAEPVVVGEDDWGCPIFEPVPCTEPLSAYDSLCGSECGPVTGVGANGDAWLIGCDFTSQMPCADFLFDPPTQCFRDPFAGNELWYTSPGCHVHFGALFCWSPCDPETEAWWGDPPDYCAGGTPR